MRKSAYRDTVASFANSDRFMEFFSSYFLFFLTLNSLEENREWHEEMGVFVGLKRMGKMTVSRGLAAMTSSSRACSRPCHAPVLPGLVSW